MIFFKKTVYDLYFFTFLVNGLHVCCILLIFGFCLLVFAFCLLVYGYGVGG